MSTRVADVVRAVHEAFPPDWAEPWDVVGLLAGDPDASVDRVFVSLDPTLQTLDRAIDAGAQVLLTHHPSFLKPAERLVPAAAGVSFAAVAAGVALVAAHTNLDRAPAGASVLPGMIGLTECTPLEDPALPVALVTVFVPASHEVQVAEAMAAAGAGRIGDYRQCSFSASGTARFTPTPASDPYVGSAGEPSMAGEVRLEMVAPPGKAAAVRAAARVSHPYEEPLIVVTDATIARGEARMGRVGRLPARVALDAFAHTVAGAFGVVPRVWGARDSSIEVVATATGSAGSLVPAAMRSGADVLLAGEVRYHDAQAARESGLCVIEIGHDVSEWPLVPVLAEAARSASGLDPEMVLVDEPGAAWWTP
jgi:dinuclear metal center YbgI/SA1388 family protein